MLCKLREKPFDDPKYIFESKIDGFRALAYVNNHDTMLFSRTGKNKTNSFPDIKPQITCSSAILDGEIISGIDFSETQRRVNRKLDIDENADKYPAVYWVFDIIEKDGINLEANSLMTRKEILNRVLVQTDKCREVPYYTSGITLFEQEKSLEGEGIVAKYKDGRYEEGKRSTWFKIKTWQTDTFIAVGYTAGLGKNAGKFGALVLADSNGNYVGNVGTGWDYPMMAALQGMFSPSTCPFPREPEAATWIKGFPVKIQYLEYTNDRILRFASFKGVI